MKNRSIIRKNRLIIHLVLLLCCLIGVSAWAQSSHRLNAGGEVPLDGAVREQLDTFESFTLRKADESFNSKKWRQAIAEFDAFILEFPRSTAVPYALVRKGRALQHDGKAFTAVEVFGEILDYFPNAVNFAAEALYRTGECYWNIGEIDNALKAWARMASDDDYRRQVRAAEAITKLADSLMEQKKDVQAAKYYEQVAIDFWDSNNRAARHASNPVIAYYISNLNEPGYRALMEQTFWRDQKDKTFEENRPYWKSLLDHVNRHNTFGTLQVDMRKRYLSYWHRVLQGRFADWDDYQLALIDMQFKVEQNATKRVAALDAQFDNHQKAGDTARLVKWMNFFRGDPQKLDSYYQKMDFAKATHSDKMMLMNFFRDDPQKVDSIYQQMDFAKATYNEKHQLMDFLYAIGRQQQARSVLGQLGFDQLGDATIEGLGDYLVGKDMELAPGMYDRLADKERATYKKFLLCHRNRQTAEGLVYANQLTNNEKYAKEVYWLKAELLQWDGQHSEALAAYRLSDRPPQHYWRIVDCYIALKNVDAAITQLQEIENFFKNEAPRAALRIAEVYKMAGNEKMQVASLRAIMMKYPRSRESSHVHEVLQGMGIQIGGAIDAE